MPTNNIPELSIPGLVTLPITATDVALIGDDNVTIELRGPGGAAVLSGPLRATYQLVIDVDRQLGRLFRPEG